MSLQRMFSYTELTFCLQSCVSFASVFRRFLCFGVICNPPNYTIRICNPLKPPRLAVCKQGLFNRIANPYNKNRRIANPPEQEAITKHTKSDEQCSAKHPHFYPRLDLFGHLIADVERDSFNELSHVYNVFTLFLQLSMGMCLCLLHC